MTKAEILDANKALQLTRWVNIKAVAVYDTVGSLGIPEITWLQWLPGQKAAKQYSFINTEVAPNVEHAYQALALDEARTPYSPTVWESPSDPNTSLKELKQCWFPADHNGIGGGYPDKNNADIVLAWTMSQLSKLLKFDSQFIQQQQDLNIAWYNDRTVGNNG